MRLSSSWTSVILGLACVYLVFLAGGGLHGFFTLDDGGNLSLSQNHGYWNVSFGRLLLSTISVVTPEYRPVGGLFYRGLYAMFGFDPLPFRVACFAILLANLILTYQVLSRWSSPLVAATAIAFTCYHASFVDLYWSTGTVYDLLCYGFFFSAILFYDRAREGESGRGWGAFVASFASFALALGSKEMAVTLPAILVLFELLRIKPAVVPVRVRVCWIVLLGTVAAASLAAKLLSNNFLKLGPLYVVHWSPSYVANSYRHYLALLSYMHRPLTNLEGALLVLGMVGVGLLVRARLYWFGLMFFFTALAPVVSLMPRAGFVMYLPLAGLGLSAAIATTALAARLSIRAAYVPVAVLTLLLPAHLAARPRFEAATSKYHAMIRRFFEQVKVKLPRPGPAPRILMPDDPRVPNEWVYLFLMRLYYNDPRLWIERGRISEADRNNLTLYDYLFSFDGQALEVHRNELRFEGNEKGIRVEFAPKRVKSGQQYTVTVKQMPGASIDVAFHLTRDGVAFSSGVARAWCRLDGSGRAVVTVPNYHPTAVVSVDVIRRSGDVWTPASGQIEVEGSRYF